MKAVPIDLSPVWRHAPFGGATTNGDIVVAGVNWSAATFALQVRPAPGDSASALISIGNAAAGGEGISASWDSAYVLDGVTVGATTIRIEIAKATLEAISWGSEDPAAPLLLAYDLHATPSGEPEFVLAYGTFALHPGVKI